MTTTEAAALLTRRGIAATADQVKRWCAAGRFSGAVKVANEWQIPQEAVATFQRPARGAPTGKRQAWKFRKRRQRAAAREIREWIEARAREYQERE